MSNAWAGYVPHLSFQQQAEIWHVNMMLSGAVREAWDKTQHKIWFWNFESHLSADPYFSSGKMEVTLSSLVCCNTLRIKRKKEKAQPQHPPADSRGTQYVFLPRSSLFTHFSQRIPRKYVSTDLLSTLADLHLQLRLPIKFGLQLPQLSTPRQPHSLTLLRIMSLPNNGDSQLQLFICQHLESDLTLFKEKLSLPFEI